MAMTSPQQMDRQTFMANLRLSGLVRPDQMAKVAGRLPDSPRAQAVAKTLIEHGLLTRFQAELLLAGKTTGFFLGQYRILDYLGRGGMGRVFKAEHQTMNRIVAVKVLAAHLVKTPKAQQLFQREVRAAARLVHPNIVTAYDANQIGERYYLVMEYVDGPNLEDLVRQRGPLPIGVACDFIRQAANGLQHAHELGMVHRDIKPANLLVQKPTSTGPGAYCTVKILDFGLARLQTWGPGAKPSGESIMAAENTVLGTPDYLSPEQARNLHSVDIRSDLYSLGCTFFYLITGRVPFPGGTTLEKLVRHSTVEPPPIEQVRPDVSPPVAAIIRRLLAKRPEQRFQSPAELAAVLAPFAVQGPGQVSVQGTPGVPAAKTSSGSSAWTTTSGSGNAGNEDEWAIGTLPLNISSTPLSFTGLPSMVMAKKLVKENKLRLQIALIAAIGIVVGFSCLVSYLVLR
jgi:serine/threonine-protein kinase